MLHLVKCSHFDVLSDDLFKFLLLDKFQSESTTVLHIIILYMYVPLVELNEAEKARILRCPLLII